MEVVAHTDWTQNAQNQRINLTVLCINSERERESVVVVSPIELLLNFIYTLNKGMVIYNLDKLATASVRSQK